MYQPFSACFNSCSRGVTWLVSRYLNVMCTLVLSNPAGRLHVLEVTIKDKHFQFIEVNGPNDHSELLDFFFSVLSCS